jgi:hypothetical protein
MFSGYWRSCRHYDGSGDWVVQVVVTLALFVVSAVVLCALAAAAVLVSGMLLILGVVSLSGLAAVLLPRRATRMLTFDDLRISSASPNRWRL